MNELILIMPAGWVQLDWQYIADNITELNSSNLTEWTALRQFDRIELPLKEHGLIPANCILEEAKFIDYAFVLVKYFTP